jgi:putative membrane protein insertion efficiency factor
MKTASTIILLIIINLCTSLRAQSGAEIAQMRSAITLPHQHDWQEMAPTQDEFQVIFSGMFLFYKSFISSQDGSECSFTPSCSVYGMKAVKNDGVVAGIVKTLDRLTRCNGFSPEKYEVDQATGKFYDPYR